MMHMLVIDGAVGDAEALYADLRRAVAVLDASNRGNWRL